MRNEYTNLGVPWKATDEQIKTKYRELMMVHHPDKGGSADKAAELSVSYNILMDKRARKRHDDALRLTGITECPDCHGRGSVVRRRVEQPCKCGGKGFV